jgi:hypothetical protein
VSVDTLRCNIESVTRAVDTIVGEEMPDLFGLMLDGWSNGFEQYLAVLGCYLVEGERRHPLVSMAPVVQAADDDHSTDTHLRAIATFFGKTLSQCLFIVGDNCGLATLMGVPLVGSCIPAHLLKELGDFQSVTMALQSADIDLLGARYLLDGLIEKKPSTKTYIGTSTGCCVCCV